MGGISRRSLLQAASLAALAAACRGGGPEEVAPSPSPGGDDGEAPEEVFTEPSTALSGSLSILLWSHFVPSHDDWFDAWAKEWGDRVGVDVTVDHVSVADVPASPPRSRPLRATTSCSTSPTSRSTSRAWWT